MCEYFYHHDKNCYSLLQPGPVLSASDVFTRSTLTTTLWVGTLESWGSRRLEPAQRPHRESRQSSSKPHAYKHYSTENTNNGVNNTFISQVFTWSYECPALQENQIDKQQTKKARKYVLELKESPYNWTYSISLGKSQHYHISKGRSAEWRTPISDFCTLTNSTCERSLKVWNAWRQKTAAYCQHATNTLEVHHWELYTANKSHFHRPFFLKSHLFHKLSHYS